MYSKRSIVIVFTLITILFIHFNLSRADYQNEIVVSQDLSDTIFIEFKVDDKGTLEITQTQIDSLVYAEIPEIEKYLYASIDSLPEIYPAIKRGQQVTTKFKLPLIVKVSEN